MHQSVSKKKIYFYLLIFLFVSTSFNFNLLNKIKETGLINSINVEGLSLDEEIIIKEELKIILNSNIFFLNKDLILEKLNQFNFLENIEVQKILPSKLYINLTKTNFLGSTIIDGEKFYIGSNGKFTISNQVKNEKNLPLVFGKFQINEFLDLQSILNKQKIDVNKINKYYYYRNKRWDLQNENGLILMLSSKDIKASLEIYKKLIDKQPLYRFFCANPNPKNKFSNQLYDIFHPLFSVPNL